MKRLIGKLALVLVTVALMSMGPGSKVNGNEEGPVKWMSFEQAVEKAKKEKRKI